MKYAVLLRQGLGYVLGALVLGACSLKTAAASPVAAATSAGPAFQAPIGCYALPSGLRVVFSPNRTAPTATVAAYYAGGFRTEPRNRVGFAHLFEHLVLQGS